MKTFSPLMSESTDVSAPYRAWGVYFVAQSRRLLGFRVEYFHAAIRLFANHSKRLCSGDTRLLIHVLLITQS
jgi:hypothetical protein